ncbi:cotranscriptional regulator FAM172A homolog [Patiria miniata]|uniref:Arb2 domain-containing protein n=1 Tax=Patiria miniata TaxID=46514 RepID=A0A914BK40_PATMI|nr:cotranscriptional regulator FAM172A homolog [Patiria miniata]XP_038076474.1 cotranscriptional regulator FAM172A homolog [Patiria miniata]
MEESSQQSMMDVESQQTGTESQQTGTESQMSIEQEVPESQSQMEVSQQLPDEEMKLECDATDLKQERDATDFKPEGDATNFKPECDATDLKPGGDTTDYKPECDATDYKPEGDGTDFKPECDATDYKPEGDGTDSKPECDATDSKPECDATVPKQPKLDHGDDPDDLVSPASTAEQTTEPDEAVGENGDGQDQEETKKETEKSTAKEEVVEKSTAKEAVVEKSTAKEAVVEDVDKDEEDSFVFPDTVAFPDTLEGFKYAFNEGGQLRHTETGEPFLFEVKKGDMRYNQLHYEALGEVITQHVYKLLESETNLKRVYLGDSENELRGFVFMSENALETTDKLLILIHGSGVVRAGQWARRLIINDCLDSGTQLPYIKRAMEEGYEVLVMNTNENFSTLADGRRVSIKGSSSPSEHGLNVWDKFVAETPAKHVAIVAHSYGGVVTIDLAVKRTESFMKKVFAVAFTDSVHSLHYDMDDALHALFTQNAVNWVSSHKPLGTVVDDRGYDCTRVSAGTTRHEETSWYSFHSIFHFLSTKEEEVKRPEVEDPVASEASEPAGDSMSTEDGPGQEDVESEEASGARNAETQPLQPPETGGQETEIGGRETEV